MSEIAVASLNKTLANLEHRLEEQKKALRYHEDQIQGVHERVVEYGKQVAALKTAIALLEKTS